MVLAEKLQRVTVYQLLPKCGWPVGWNPGFKLVGFSLFLIFNCDSHLLPPHMFIMKIALSLVVKSGNCSTQ